MLKVVCVVDKVDTALDRLAKGVIPYHDNIEYSVVDVHPKRPSTEQLEEFKKEAMGADVLDFQYFKSAEMLLETFDWLKDKKKILTHNNPYSINDSDWNNYDLVIGNNQYIYNSLLAITNKPVEYIPLVQDINFFQYRREFKPNNNVIMVANRIEGKKGILPAALACADAGKRLILVGAISDRNYWTSVMATQVVDFHEQVSDEELLDLYNKSTLHICNSVDNFESGTLPILEAMMTGVPVLTRRVGHVADLDNGENMVINENDPEESEKLADLILQTMSDHKKLNKMREKAWDTVKSRNFERRAYSYQKLYRQVMSENVPVSVVMPIHSDETVIRKSINAVLEQDYDNVELILVNDGSKENKKIYDEIKYTKSIPIKYLESDQGDYGLARARNMGIIEATGEIIVFCDQRMVMHKDAVRIFSQHLSKNFWLFGDKDGKKNFVENFSAVYRDDIIKIGMFNERITGYGGMSQEIRVRANMNGITTKLVSNAKAKPMGSSKNKYTKKPEIVAMKNMLWKIGL